MVTFVETSGVRRVGTRWPLESEVLSAMAMPELAIVVLAEKLAGTT
ncbi:MAG: hypothetical protein NVS2B16_12460 [Chloroflexota bacterium]